MRHILGISAFYHDAAAALLRDGQILAAAQEERFSRKKNDERFPHHAIQFCLTRAGLAATDLDAVVFYDPMLSVRLLANLSTVRVGLSGGSITLHSGVTLNGTVSMEVTIV